MQRSPVRKKTRLDRCILPVSSGEELDLVILQEQNKRLSRNYIQRIKIEEDLRNRIVKLEATLRECEEKNPDDHLAIVNRDLSERNEELEHQLQRSRLAESRLQAELDEIHSISGAPGTTSTSAHNHTSHNHLTSQNHDHSDQTLVKSEPGYAHQNHQNAHTHSNHLNIKTENCATQCTTSNNHVNIQDHMIDTNSSNSSSCSASSINKKHHSNSNFVNRDSTTNCVPNNNASYKYEAKCEELERMYQDEHELAENRLKELEKINEDHRKVLVLVEKLQQDLKCLPESIIFKTAEYKTLQSHFSVLWNEATQLKIQLDDARKELQDCKNEHLKQIERMEAEELALQQRLHNEINKLEDNLSLKSREYDKLRIDYENTLQKNQSLAPQHAELKRNWNSLHSMNTQLRQDLNRLISNGTHKSQSGTGTSGNVKSLNNSKSGSSSLLDVDTLTHEIEITGQAYDELQEQYQRLLQQLSEKDEANFKLMSERLKANISHRLMQEKELALESKIDNLEKQLERQHALVATHLNKERLLHENLDALEKALHSSNQSIETQRQISMEAQQCLADLKLQKEKYCIQLKEIQDSLSSKTDSLQQERFKTKRLTEELESWRRKYERAKKFESASTADEVLMEELREYKEQLTCPSCKTKPKDAVITKCFHVFCFDCLRVRVETRQRKCPKCNAQFGVNDYHRLYLA